jgi:hypothetical protein
MAQRYRQRTEADGSRENQPTMDGARGALLPIAAGFRLKPLNLDAVAVSGRGEVGERASRRSRMGPSLQDEVACPDCPMTKNQPEGWL